MGHNVETIERKGYTIEIDADYDSESPREWDNLGTFAFFHSRYAYGDKDIPFSQNDFNSWNEMNNHIIKKVKAVVCLPVYMYDHSGISFKVGSFAGLLPEGHAHFDTMPVGFIYVTAAQVRENFMVKRATKGHFEHAEKILRSEIETLNQHTTGDVYSIKITDTAGEEVENCCGFYGLKETIAEAEAIVDNGVKFDLKQKLKKLKAYILNKVPLHKRSLAII